VANTDHLGPPATAEEQEEVAGKRIAQLEERLRTMPKGRPFEKGVVRFNLGVAYRESPSGDRPTNLSRAFASLEAATKLFDPSTSPLEHARAQNMLGITFRDLGRLEEASAAFRTAADMIPMEVNAGEHGAPMNNLGLTLMDMGKVDEGIDAFTDALKAFADSAYLRQRVDTLHNLGQAEASYPEPERIGQGIDRYLAALEITDPQEFPYQWALLENSLGVAYTAVDKSHEAAVAFGQALRVFTRSRWPFQHALAKNNLALANIQLGDIHSLRQAVAACEDALMVLDVRIHREQWEQVYRNLELAERSLKEAGEPGTRTQHFVRMLAEDEPDVLLPQLRERLTQNTELPEPRRLDALTEFDLAVLDLKDEGAQKVTNAWLHVLMELPHENFLAGLTARMRAHKMLDDAGVKRATRLLDHTIQNELLAPQRIRVRDTLYTFGYERPSYEPNPERTET